MRYSTRRGRAILLLAVFTTAGLLVARELAGQSRQHGAGAVLRGRSALAEAAAEPLGARLVDRRLGGRARSRLDDPSRLGDAGREGEGARDEAVRRVLRARRRRCSSSMPTGTLVGHWGGPGRRLRVADVQSRHHRRPQGQRVDRRQRARRLAGPQVQPRRQVPAAGRQGRRPHAAR